MKKVAIFCGGKSEEHEISLISAKHVIEELDSTQFEVLVIGISKQGTWHLCPKDKFFIGEARADQIKLNTNNPVITLLPFANSQGQATFLVEGKEILVDVMFPVLHGPFGEDGTIQGLFEMIGVPFVGAGCETSALCMDKELTKSLCASRGLSTARYVVFYNHKELGQKKAEVEALGYPVFVKPARMGSSVGISKVENYAQLGPALEKALKVDTKALVEEALVGREIECAVLGPPHNAEVALPGEIVPKGEIGFYSYEGKYLMQDGAKLHAPATLDEGTAQSLQAFAVRAYQIVECHGLARVDTFLLANGEIYLNEINTLPGFTPISMYPKLWQVSGLSYQALLSRLIELAFLRAKT